MDTSDSEIRFDENGVCGHCTAMERRLKSIVKTDPFVLERIVTRIRNAGKGKQYDCILGISGGTDSTYLAYLAKEFGLRPLAVHLDNGWNYELAVQNIEHVLNHLGIDLYTHVLDWDEFRDLQVAFLKASTPDCEVPSDHAINGTLFQTAHRFRIKYILQGTNMRTEGIMATSWSYGQYDWHYIRSVHHRFGTVPLKDYPHFSLMSRITNFAIRRLRVISLLNYVDYQKEAATTLLKEKLDWRDYGVKHGESVYTRFYQSYILPKKFGADKRRGHLSSLIVAGQVTREQALQELSKPPYPEEQMASEREYVIKKLGLTEAQFAKIMQTPPKTYRDYPNQAGLCKRIGVLVDAGKRLGILAPTTGL